MDLEYQKYPTKIFIDSNVVLECLPLKNLPWDEVDPIGPILLLLTPTLLREVDSKKRDGRLAVRAREFNRSIAPIADGASLINLRAEAPRVDIAMAICNKIDWASYDDLDPSQGDARLVAEVLNVRTVPFEERVVISQDINPLFMAKRHGLKTYHISDSWLGQPEQSLQEKEIAKLRRQISEYAKSEPSFNMQLERPSGPLNIFQVNPLSEKGVEDLIGKILEMNPKPVQDKSALGMTHILGGYDYTLDERYDEYESVIVPRFAADVHKKLELCYGQIPFEIILENTGKVRADQLCIKVEVVGGWFNLRPIFARKPPAAPYIKDRFDLRVPISAIKKQVEVNRHEVEVSRPKRSTKFSAQCENFRQGQKWGFSAILWADPHAKGDLVVIVKATAANLHGEVSEVFKLKKEVNTKNVYELVAESDFSPLVQSYVDPIIKSAIKNKNFSQIEVESFGRDK